MNKIFEWLTAKLESYPLVFVIIGGCLAYFVGLGLFVLGIYGADRMAWWNFAGIFIGASVGAFVIVMFHWFIARFERRSTLAQALALGPAVFMVMLVVIGATALGSRTEICIPNEQTGGLDCRVVDD